MSVVDINIKYELKLFIHRHILSTIWKFTQDAPRWALGRFLENSVKTTGKENESYFYTVSLPIGETENGFLM